MPERFDRVTILLNDGPVVTSWDERIELLQRIDTTQDAGQYLHVRFLGVGATREVTPNLDEKRCLRGALGGPQPAALEALRDALDDDLRDAEQGVGDA